MHDKKTASDVKLSDEDLEIIKNIQSGHYADKEMDPYKVSALLSPCKALILNLHLFLTCGLCLEL